MYQMIDAHIHLDFYREHEKVQLLNSLEDVLYLISVSFNLESCKRNLELSRQFSKVKPAFGFHPEQPLPSDSDIENLFKWIQEHSKDMIAVGEVGLPYYLRKKGNLKSPNSAYIDLLEKFIQLSKELDKPVVLHAVYDDAPIVCDLLERYSVTRAHFHWFKGDKRTIKRMIENGYYVSITPDIVYEKEIIELVQLYPVELLMVETDGPWPFEGPFTGKMTHPHMIHQSIEIISKLKSLHLSETYDQILQNSKSFYIDTDRL